MQRHAISFLAAEQLAKPKPSMLAQLFEDHFERLVAVELHADGQTINAYLNAKANGSYQILTLKGELILEVSKSFSGWSVSKVGSIVGNPEQFFTPLILMLERKFYN